MEKRDYKDSRILFYTVIALTFSVIISWAGYVIGYVSLQTAIKGSVIALLLACSAYALQRFVLAFPSRWRNFRRIVFILCGTFWIGFFLWIISVHTLRLVFGLSADISALLASPSYLLGAFLGDKLWKHMHSAGKVKSEY